MINQPTALKIAKYFIWKANKENKKITNKKLQKLLYYAQAWHLVFEDKPLFKDNIEAWVHGPAVAIVYDQYKKFGREPIQEKINDLDIIDIQDKDALDDVWNVYGKYDAEYLEVLTHNELPWQKAREQLDSDTPSNAIISLDVMKDFYNAVYKKYSSHA